MVLRCERDRVGTRRGGDDAEAGLLQPVAQERAQVRVVLGDENERIEAVRHAPMIGCQAAFFMPTLARWPS